MHALRQAVGGGGGRDPLKSGQDVLSTALEGPKTRRNEKIDENHIEYSTVTKNIEPKNLKDTLFMVLH